MTTSRLVDANTKVGHLVQCLDALAQKWRPGVVVYSQPSGIHWLLPALELLDTALAKWSGRRNLAVYAYTAQEVRAAIAGHPNIRSEELTFAIMSKLGLVGQAKSTHEWEALAVGHYHASRVGAALVGAPGAMNRC